MSLPARGRGSKLVSERRRDRHRTRSLPARGRGSKPLFPTRCRGRCGVAPRAGAWIETAKGTDMGRYRCVAPRAGAWIETASIGASRRRKRSSLPARGRGSKPSRQAHAHRAGVSLPARGRGSKPTLSEQTAAPPGSRSPRGGVDRNSQSLAGFSHTEMSLPARGRGSKHRAVDAGEPAVDVAPRAGAWIETP